MPSMSERRKATDERIYRAAIEEFGRRGYVNTTLSNIAKSAGITPGLIVQNFGSKEELYRKISLDITDRIYRLFSDLTDDWHNRCVTIVRRLKEQLELHENAIVYLDFYVSLITSLDTPDDVLNELYEMYNRSPVELLIRGGQEAGDVIEGDPYSLHSLFWTTLYNTIQICYNNRLDYPDDEWFVDVLRKH